MLKQTILAIEVNGPIIRGVLLRGRKRKIGILDYAELDRTRPDEDLPDIETLKKIKGALKYTGKASVYVTALARSTELFMDRKKVGAMSHFQLCEAAKWEIEPYTGITGANALVGVETETRPKAAPGEIVYEEDSDEVMVNISAMEKNVYVAVKERFKAAGLRLARIYPPEVCFYMPLFLEDMDTPRAILEIGRDYSNFAIFKGRHPDQISTLNFTCDALAAYIQGGIPSPDLESSLKFTLSQAPEHEPVILTGPGAAIPSILNYLDRFSPSGARTLMLSRSMRITSREPDPADAVFGTTAGAGIRELGGKTLRRVGVDDTEPLMVRVKRNVYVMPLVATGVIALGLLGHNQFMKYQDRQYRADIEKYTRDLEENKSTIQKYETLLKRSAQLKADIRTIRDRINYVNQKADRKLEVLITCFKGLAGSVPKALVLDTVSQEEAAPEQFRITGRSWDLNSIGLFATALQDQAWCRSAILKSLDSDGGRRLKFEMGVQIDPESVAIQ